MNLDVVHTDLIAGEPEIAPLICVKCGTEIETTGEPWPEKCPNCHHPIDLRTQFAYCRGRDAFIAGQELLIKISPNLRKKNLTTEAEMEGLQYYNQAYTSFQIAFQGQLAESQRRLAIEIMAAIVMVFEVHSSISPVEASYWKALMMELTMQIDRAQVLDKINQIPLGVKGIFLRWRWQLRVKQLDNAMLEVNQKIMRLERIIRFVDPPRVRRKILPPLE